ncbi:YnfA family protein [Roseomonas elaeocarpi]|uniref:YnfA family protein n=1 Tax=Roseomonas elaeocarpi TaxID=907779 RepID=A0ABV6JYM3_9PROT
MRSILVFAAAAALEIGGCFAVWCTLRQGASAWWLLPGSLALAGFASLLTLAGTGFAGRAYAAYGGIYVAASVLWLWLVEGVRPDRWDLLGAAVVLLGTGVILLAPRGG